MTEQRDLTISQNSLSVRTQRWCNQQYDVDSRGRTIQTPPEYLGIWTFRFAFDSPPAKIIPGKPVTLTVRGTANGETKIRETHPKLFSANFVYSGSSGLKFERHPETLPYGYPILQLNEKLLNKNRKFTFMIAAGLETRIKEVKLRASLHEMVIEWTYRPV